MERYLFFAASLETCPSRQGLIVYGDKLRVFRCFWHLKCRARYKGVVLAESILLWVPRLRGPFLFHFSMTCEDF